MKKKTNITMRIAQVCYHELKRYLDCAGRKIDPALKSGIQINMKMYAYQYQIASGGQPEDPPPPPPPPDPDDDFRRP